MFDEGSWIGIWDWLIVNVTDSLQAIEYYVFIDAGWYKQDKQSDWVRICGDFAKTVGFNKAIQKLRGSS